ncbi:MAG: hypothetical protein V4609_01475 [Pseudomonadota bacterium]
MTTFIQVSHPTEHPGVVRAERVIANVRELSRRASVSSFVLAALVAAVVVVANEVVSVWTDGHLLAAWIVMWLIAFSALALLAVPARRATAGLRGAFARWQVARRQAADDRVLWAAAMADARVMADIRQAMDAQPGLVSRLNRA